jgi:2,3-bisphosphoglycerate-independent phosphoglycerate mutase
MTRHLAVVPDLFSESIFPLWSEAKVPHLDAMASRGEVFRLSAIDPAGSLEAGLLGLPPGEGEMALGPLVALAMELDIPPRSTPFSVSTLTMTDGILGSPTGRLGPEMLAEAGRVMERLSSKSLWTFWKGQDGCLVWTSWGDSLDFPPEKAVGQPYRDVWPQGDPDRPLQQFIEDSHELLRSNEVVKRLMEAERPYADVLWPHGGGRMRSVPSLALARGEVLTVAGGDVKLEGLTRRVGYRFLGRSVDGREMQTPFADRGKATIGVYPEFSRLVELGLLDEAAWWLREFDAQVVGAFEPETRPSRFVLVGPSAKSLGLTLRWDSEQIDPTQRPLRPDVLEEAKVPVRPFAGVCADALLPLVEEEIA